MIEIKQWHGKNFFIQFLLENHITTSVNYLVELMISSNKCLICQEKIEEKLQKLNTAKSPVPGCLQPRVLYETRAVIA